MITEFQGGRRVRNHSVPEGKCSMLFCRKEKKLKLLPHGSEKCILAAKAVSDLAKPLSMKFRFH